MRTVSGEEIDIISGGEENNDCGPDFGNVIIFINGNGPVTGDIEIHVKSSDWRAHGHHLDPSYNKVILHVVMWHNSAPTVLENSVAVPVLSLADCLGDSRDEVCRMLIRQAVVRKPCQSTAAYWSTDGLAELLDSTGEARFIAKAEKFHQKMQAEYAEEVFYQGILDALGYARNRTSFQRLGHYLPVSFLKNMNCGKDSAVTMQAIMLGTAGLLPSQRKRFIHEEEPFMDNIENIWREMGFSCEMREQEWHFFRVRPSNYPPRRIAALSHLIVRNGRQSMVDRLWNIVHAATDYRVLEDEFIIPADGYWQSHFDCGMAGALPTLLGRARAAEIVQNIVLPFFLAYAEKERLPGLKQKVELLFHGYPKREGNKIIRLMLQRMPGKTADVITTVQRQQGLLCLYHNYCVGEKCGECPMVKSPSITFY